MMCKLLILIPLESFPDHSNFWCVLMLLRLSRHQTNVVCNYRCTNEIASITGLPNVTFRSWACLVQKVSVGVLSANANRLPAGRRRRRRSRWETERKAFVFTMAVNCSDDSGHFRNVTCLSRGALLRCLLEECVTSVVCRVSRWSILFLRGFC